MSIPSETKQTLHNLYHELKKNDNNYQKMCKDAYTGLTSVIATFDKDHKSLVSMDEIDRINIFKNDCIFYQSDNEYTFYDFVQSPEFKYFSKVMCKCGFKFVPYANYNDVPLSKMSISVYTHYHPKAKKCLFYTCAQQKLVVFKKSQAKSKL